jgi:pyruvate/2-oxoacid:ferredoxin oxidoreductase alpha subunit
MHIIEAGNVAAAMGVNLAGVQVVAAYPITPQTPLTEKLSELVDAGEMDAQYIPVESEHSAMSVCIAASSAGSRAFTATSANGLLYMNEQLHWAAGARLPIVMCVVNRGIGAPWTVWNDHQDSMSQRDTGWIQLYCCDHQQIIDTVIQAFHIAETVRAPVMVCYDGYILSHTYMPFDIPEQAEVEKFLPAFSPDWALNPGCPTNLNTVTLPDPRPDVRGNTAPGYMEIRHNLHTDLRRVIDVTADTDAKFAEIFGRGGHPFIGRKGVMVFEKAVSYGYEGPLFSDTKAALYGIENPPVVRNFILGLGGREIQTRDLYRTIKTACTETQSTQQEPDFIGLKL